MERRNSSIEMVLSRSVLCLLLGSYASAYSLADARGTLCAPTTAFAAGGLASARRVPSALGGRAPMRAWLVPSLPGTMLGGVPVGSAAACSFHARIPKLRSHMACSREGVLRGAPLVGGVAIACTGGTGDGDGNGRGRGGRGRRDEGEGGEDEGPRRRKAGETAEFSPLMMLNRRDMLAGLVATVALFGRLPAATASMAQDLWMDQPFGADDIPDVWKSESPRHAIVTGANTVCSFYTYGTFQNIQGSFRISKARFRICRALSRIYQALFRRIYRALFRM